MARFAAFALQLAVASFMLVACAHSSISLGSCKLTCDENEDVASSYLSGESVVKHKSAFSNPKAPRVLVSEEDALGASSGACDCSLYDELLDRIKRLEEESRKVKEYSFVRSCRSMRKYVNTSGLYVIFPFEESSEGLQVYCDQDVSGGGWIVIQRRISDQVDFYRGWDDYVRGFGNKEGDFWLGLENIHRLTRSGSYELRVDMEDFDGKKAFAIYNHFALDGEEDNYRITVFGASGTAGDSLLSHNLQPFTTKDRQNDNNPDENCAVSHRGGWWYNHCHDSNLNGEYNGSTYKAQGVSWRTWKNSHVSLKRVDMKIRPNMRKGRLIAMHDTIN